MRKSLLLITIFLISFSAIAQTKIKGNRNVITNTIELDYFSKIELNDKIEVVLNQSNENKIVLEADENLHDVLDADVKDGTLILSLNKRITRSKRFNITLYAEDLDQITLNDDSELEASGRLELFNLDLVLNNKSDIKLENLRTEFLRIDAAEKAKANLIIKTDSLSVDTKESARLKLDVVTQGAIFNYDGSSTVEAVGKTENLTLNATDNAAFKGAEFISDTVVLNALNKTDTYVNAKNFIEIDAKNKAEIYLFNKPEITLRTFQDNVSLYKRESMSFLQKL